MAQKRYFMIKPDTPEKIQAKITKLSVQLIVLTESLDRNKKDILLNHLNYGDQKIAYVKDILEKTAKQKRLTESKLCRLKSKLCKA